jgi:hypothetical protein
LGVFMHIIANTTRDFCPSDSSAICVHQQQTALRPCQDAVHRAADRTRKSTEEPIHETQMFQTAVLIQSTNLQIPYNHMIFKEASRFHDVDHYVLLEQTGNPRVALP